MSGFQACMAALAALVFSSMSRSNGRIRWECREQKPPFCSAIRPNPVYT